MATARRPQAGARPRHPGLGRRPVSAATAAWLVAAWVGWAVAAAAPARAQDAAPPSGKAAPSTAAPSVHLDKLLKLPDESSYKMDKRGGLSRGEWRDLFQKAKESLAHEKKALAAAQAKMDEVARGKNPWKVGPAIPGFSGSNSGDAPLDYKLQQEIKQRRQRVRNLEEQLRQLGIKADLAGVPADWRS